MSTTGPYTPALPVAGTIISTTAFGLVVARALRYQLGIPSSGDDERPQASLQQTVAQSIPNNASTAVLFDSELLDVGGAGGHSTSTNTSRWTCQTGKGGWYNVFGTANFVFNGTGERTAQIRINGTTIIRQATDNSVTTSPHVTSVLVGGKIALSAGDYIELLAYQNSGGALNTSLSPASTLDIEQCRAQ